jgi:hypothetical protein
VPCRLGEVTSSQSVNASLFLFDLVQHAAIDYSGMCFHLMLIIFYRDQFGCIFL